jgi:hypothetical protein
VKDHLPGKCQEKVRGWGWNFLKKVVVMQVKDAVKSSLLSTCYAQQALSFSF